jgi:hypothetical protein
MFSGVPGVSSIFDTVGSSIFGVRSIYPYNFPVSVNPLIPYNVYYPYVPNIVRNDLQSIPVSLRDVYQKPVMIIVKSTPEAEGLTAYVLENGLSSLADNPRTRFIHEMIKTGAEKTAVVVHPSVLYNIPAYRILRDMPVVKFEVPSGIKFANLVHIISNNMPYVFIHDKEDVNNLDFEGLIRVGSFDIAEEKIICSSCY